MNKVKTSFARSSFDNLLNQAIKKVLEEELDKKIKLGRVQHTVMLLIKEYKNYYIHSIGHYRLLSLKRIKNYKITKNKNTVVKIPPAFNTASLFLDSSNIYKIEIQSIAKMLESLYIEGFITYPRTEGIALEEDTHNKLFKKASELYELNKMFFIGNYENAISPLNLEKRFSGNMNKIFNMIVRRSIASMLDNYLTTSLEYKLTFNGEKLKKIYLLQDDKNILSKIYTPDYILDYGEEHKPYYIGNGVTEYEIIKLLSAYNIGKPSTLPYLMNLLKTKKFISKDYDDTFSLLDLGNEIIKILKKRMPFLDIEFYQYINKDFDYISRGMQNWSFPIIKLQNELKKNNINIDKIDFNYSENNEESEYKKMWVDFENNDEKGFSDIILKNI
jgi:DNA topoisomerase IA